LERIRDVDVSQEHHPRSAEFIAEDQTHMKMKIWIALLFLPVSLAFAANLSGRWSGTFRATGADHDIPQLFILKQDGTVLHGSGGPDSTEQYPIENGRIDGNKVTFELTTGEWKFSYRLEVSEREMTGGLDLKSGNNARTAKVSLRRIE
jgi:hypothetical protein